QGPRISGDLASPHPISPLPRAMGLLSRLNKLSVDDKGAVGAASGHFEAADAAEAVTALVESGTPVTISIEAHGLPDRDVFSKSDAMAVLFIS
ncbi:hypothetical protein, partial [Klebsiella pneumoniae]|uniref:hypothetical protein n=1 Tax=Klebsiella pneumoniae TaxID=573 RepID=UPI0025A14F9E